MMKGITCLAAGLAAAAALALPAQAAAATTQTQSCNQLGVLPPVLSQPSCTTAAVQFGGPAQTGSTYSYNAISTATAVVGFAGVRIVAIVNGVVSGTIAQCSSLPGHPAYCTATYHQAGGVPPDSTLLQIKCVWSPQVLAAVSITRCAQSMTINPPTA